MPVRRILPTILTAALLVSSGAGAPAHPGESIAQLTVWAWERAEDLQFLPANVGVAYLAGSVYLERLPVARPRMQPLEVNPDAAVTAVVRLENSKTTPHNFPQEYRRDLARKIVDLSNVDRVSALQIDFDATQSQRNFYIELLSDIRRDLPPGIPLSITALGSWCQGDDWLGGLPIHEAVPMFFRMGPDGGTILRQLASGRELREPLCRSSAGVSTDEAWPESLRGKEVYIFNPRPWAKADFAEVERRLQR